MIIASDYHLAEGAEPLLLHHFTTVKRAENFGNARDARKLFELLRKVQSQRLRTLPQRPSLAELQLLTAEDIRSGLAAGS